MRDLRVWALWAVVCVAGGCGEASPPVATRADGGAPPASWQREVQRRIVAGTYAFAAQGGQAYRFRNRAQGLAGEVVAEGARVRGGQGGAGEPVTVGLVAWGGDGGVREVAGSAPTLGECGSDGEVDAGGECLRRVEVARDGVTEWWENGIRGLEQGFVLGAPPDGSGAVVLEVGVTGAVARVEGSGTAARLEVPGGTDLRYSGLRAWDATGRDLASRMEGTAGGVRLRVETAGAVYPVTVDPLLAAVGWTAESDQASARFGFSVSSAGDVNGDGYGDVVVGAPYYDGGESYEGAAFLYLGSSSGLSAYTSWSAESDVASALFGGSVASAGDVNGDGYGDVVVGATGYSNGESNEGAASLYLGSSSGLSPSASWTAESDQAYAYFGYSVSSAGDVNGDGYADVLVGAHRYDNGETDEGAAFLYLGSSSGLLASASWTAESDQAGGYFGYSVSSAGDVNGDGYGDVVVGARDYDHGETNEGAAFLYLGSSSGLSASVSWTAESDQASGYLGYSVSSAGDVNGDGYADVVVGAAAYSDGESFEGAAFLYLGSSSGLSASASWTAESDQASAYYGTSVSSAGDVNGDGYGDVVVGASFYDNGETDEGAAFVYLGSSSGLSPAASWTAESDQASASFGFSASPAGDVNGDGYGDLVVGSYRYDNGETDEGAAFLYPGSSSGLSLSASWTAESDQASARFGFSVSSAGDVNGDGYGDVVVGAPYYDGGESYEGAAFLYLGSSLGLSAYTSWSAESDVASALFGGSVASAGDVNGDGYGDVVVGATGYSNGESNEGAASLYLGSSSGLSPSASWTAESDQAYAYFGYSVSSAGDVNGDGYADVLVGAYRYDNGETDEGAAFLYLGSSSGLLASASWTAESDQAGGYFGYSVSSAGDVNGDGYGDVVVGARDYDNGETNEGAAFLYLGSSSGLSASASWTAESDQAYAIFGYSVSSAGDVNGDGYADVVVGAPGYSNGESFEGAAFLYLGSSSGLSAYTSWTAESDQASAYCGASVSCAGDVNGDGYGDVVVGASFYDNGETDEGAAFVYLGSSSGLSPAASWTAESDQASTSFGFSVSSAGDVNGDGYADVVAGAYRYDDGETDEGAAFLYLGNGGDGVGPGTDLVPQARRVGETTPVATGGFSGTDGAFDVAATGRSGIGRGRVKLQVEAKPLGIPFDGTGFVEGSAYTDTGVGGTDLQVTVGGLDHTESYHWRARLLEDPSTATPQGWSRWLWGGVYGEAEGSHVFTGSADDDEDGWSVWSGDCDDADPASFPGAVEVCGDAVDQDCDGTADDGCGADCSISPIGPADGADLTAGPTFIWSGDCDGYRVEISPYDGFPANEVYVFGNFADDPTDNSFSPSASIWSAIGRAFTVEGFWRVVGGLDGLTVASAPRSFYTTLYPLPAPPAPVPGCMVSQGGPADGAAIVSPPTFIWTTDCTGAYLEVSSDPDFALESTYYFGAVSGGHYTMSSTIWNALDGHFTGSGGYWRVTAGAAEGDVVSASRSFTVP